MPRASRLPRQFFDRPAVQVARELLGARLVRLEGNTRLAGIIVEAEAYCGEEDLACHARAGRTRRTEVMYGPAGVAYVYFTYGMHWMLNFVTGAEGRPEAVLIRAIRPTEGIEIIAARRTPRPEGEWTDGPAKLCRALGIDGSFNGADLADPDADLFVEAGELVLDEKVRIGPRVGLGATPEPWLSKPWRFRFIRG
jgi:DNA-3-methyladenine glycosylase